jgi:cell wall-associated NlpC family hydrolase
MSIGGGEFIHSAGGVGVIITNLNEPRFRDIYWGARRIRFETWESGCPVEE